MKLKPQFYMPNDILYRENDIPLEMYFIIAGVVRLYVVDENNLQETLIRRLSDGDHFGAKYFLDESNSKRRSNARMETYTWLMCLSKKSLGEIISRNLSYAFEIKKLLVSSNVSDDENGESKEETKKESEKKQDSNMLLKMSKSHRKILIREKLRKRALAMDAVQAFLNAGMKKTLKQ